MGDAKSHNNPKRLILNNYFRVCGGDEGIRTLERLPVTPLAGEHLRPLGDVSADPRNDKNPYAQGCFSHNRQDAKCGPIFVNVQNDAGTCTQVRTKLAQFVPPWFRPQSTAGLIWC